jgi:hypothetical protein
MKNSSCVPPASAGRNAVSAGGSEYQPAVACVHGFQPRNAFEDGAVRSGIFAVEHDMSSDNDGFPAKSLGKLRAKH